MLAVLFVTPAGATAWAHCAGWSPSVADRHACCRGGALETTARATACCAMSERSGGRGPVEAPVATGPVKMARYEAPPVALAVPVAVSALHAPVLVPAFSPVPLYLRQVSLLI